MQMLSFNHYIKMQRDESSDIIYHLSSTSDPGYGSDTGGSGGRIDRKGINVCFDTYYEISDGKIVIVILTYTCTLYNTVGLLY